MINRRGLISAMGASLIVAPAIVKASSLMPIKVAKLDTPFADYIENCFRLGKPVTGELLFIERPIMVDNTYPNIMMNCEVILPKSMYGSTMSIFKFKPTSNNENIKCLTVAACTFTDGLAYGV